MNNSESNPVRMIPSGSDGSNVAPIEVNINPGDASSETVTDLLLAVTSLYEGMGGSPLKIVEPNDTEAQ